MENHTAHMKRALELAQQGRGRTSPNPMVGAVVVKEGEVVGEGFHRQAGLPHAEVYALQAAGEQAKDATLYVTLEPCNHHGRTPPCTDLILQSGIKRMVIAMQDPNPLVDGSGLAHLRQKGIEVIMGVEEEAARQLNEVFIKYILTKRPFVLMKSAMSLDGKIATEIGDSEWMTSDLSREYVHELRSTYDAVMVGSGTIIKDNPQLTCRLPGGRDPLRIILDSQAKTPLNSKIFLRSGTGTLRSNNLIVVSSEAPEERVRALQSAGAEVICCSDDRNMSFDPRIDLKKLVMMLGKRGISSILMESGGTLNASALHAGIVDKILLFVAPKIIGGMGAPTPVEGDGISMVSESLNLYNMSCRMLDRDVVIEGYTAPLM